jgi:hypothetical protein
MQFVMPILSIHSWDLLDQGTLRGKPTLNPEEPAPEPRKLQTKIAQALKIRKVQILVTKLCYRTDEHILAILYNVSFCLQKQNVKEASCTSFKGKKCHTYCDVPNRLK